MKKLLLLAALCGMNAIAGTVYFTAHGKTYHTNPHCMALAKSATVLHADEKDAIAHGLKPCGIEAHNHKGTAATAKKTDNSAWGTK